MDTSKDWDYGPEMHIEIAQSYCMVIAQLADETIEVIAIITSHCDHNVRQAFHMNHFLYSVARMAYYLVRGIYYAPVEAFTFRDHDMPPVRVSKQLHAYLHYMAYGACISHGVMAEILDTLDDFETKKLLTPSQVNQVERLDHLYDAYMGAEGGEDDYVPSLNKYTKSAGMYAKAFNRHTAHPDTGRFASAVANRHLIRESMNTQKSTLRKACVRMGGAKETRERRFTGAQNARLLVIKYYPVYG